MAMRIPKHMLEEMGLSADQEVELTIIDGELRVRPLRSVPDYDLRDLVKGITASTRHTLVLDEGPVGREVW
jgi:antitoxin MazE